MATNTFAAGVPADTIRVINGQFDKDFSLAFMATPVSTADLVQNKTAKGNVITMATLLQVPKMRQWLGAKNVKSLQTVNLSTRAVPFEATVGVDRSDILSDNIGMYSDLPAMLGAQGKKHQDQLYAQTIQCGHSGNIAASSLWPGGLQTTNLADGANLFATNHTWQGSSVAAQSNNIFYTSLSQASISDAVEKMLAFVGDDGQPLNIFPKYIACAPQDYITILNSVKAIYNPVVGSNAAVPLDNILSRAGVWSSYFNLDVVPVLELSNEAGVAYLHGLAAYGALKPCQLYDFIAPHLVPSVNPDSQNVFMDKRFLWSLEAERLMVFPLWFQTIRMTTLPL